MNDVIDTDQTEQLMKEAYLVAEHLLREAATTAKTAEQFVKNISRCQIIGQRLLGLIIFNSSVSTKSDPKELLDKVVDGIRFEIEEMSEAFKNNETDSIDIELKNDLKNSGVENETQLN